jgi:hypothetical protein
MPQNQCCIGGHYVHPPSIAYHLIVANSHRPTSDQFDDLQRAGQSAARQKTTNDTAEVVYLLINQPVFSARATKTTPNYQTKSPSIASPTIAPSRGRPSTLVAEP